MNWLELVNNIGCLIIGGIMLSVFALTIIRAIGTERRMTSKDAIDGLDKIIPMIRKEAIETFKELKELEEHQEWKNSRRNEYSRNNKYKDYSEK